jgi:hypothetical protein
VLGYPLLSKGLDVSCYILVGIMEHNEMTTRKAITVLFVLIFLLGTTFVVPSSWVGVTKVQGNPLVLKSQEELKALSGDTDRNNTPDWQDLLIGSMSSSTQEQSEKLAVTEAAKKRLDDPNNLTSSMTKNIYTAQAYAKKSGELTKAQQDGLVQKIVQEESLKIVVKEYEIKDLHITKTNTEEVKRAYGNAVGKLFAQADTYKLGSSDVAIMQAYNTSKDTDVLASLVVKKDNVDRIITSALTLPVPISAVPYHLLAINRLSRYKTVLENMAKVSEDPVRAALAFNSYQETVTGIFSSLLSLQKYFQGEGVTFIKSEPGAIFNSAILK